MSTRYVGAPVRRLEDRRLLTGQGRFVDDLDVPGTLHAAFVRSPLAHARVRSVDVSAARQTRGVVAAFALGDLDAPFSGMRMFQQYPHPLIRHDRTQHLLAQDEVCFVGQTVAVVVAESRYAAEDGVDLVEVDYEELPAMVDCRRALEPGAPCAHSDLPDNLVAQLRTTFGDADDAFAGAHVVVGATFLQHRGGCHSMETRGVLAQDDERDGLTVWSSTQVPYTVRRTLARYLAVDEERVRVIAPDVGGGFGPKAAFYPEEVVIPVLARTLRRPVKWVEDRREHFVATNTTRDQSWEIEVAATEEGKITGLRGRAVLDCGAYVTYGVIHPMTSLTPLPGAYSIPAVDVSLDVVFTNTTPNSAVRGAGRPYAIFAVERAIELVARELRLDPAEARRRNLIRPEQMPYETGAKARDGSPILYDSGDYPACLEKALALADYDGFPERQRAALANGRHRGIGIGVCIEDTGVGPYEGATVRVTPQGAVVVRTGAASQGQGHETFVAQIVAERLGVRLDDVRVESGDTSRFPHGAGTIGSRVAATLAPATHDAAGQVRATALRLGAQALEVSEDDLELAEGTVRVKGAPDRHISLGDLALRLAPGIGLRVPAGFTASLEATSYLPSTSTPIANGTNVAEVEIDPETGRVDVVRYSVAHDCGTLLNPLIVDGQIIGGVAHGLGNTLFERLPYDESGQPQATSYLDYLLLSAPEMPEVEIVHLETPSPLNALGVKGAGEGGTIPATPAIVAAIENALEPCGVTIDRYPIDPGMLVELIRAGRA
jgi:carbon-monoxide dehydrogenase large subunit